MLDNDSRQTPTEIASTEECASPLQPSDEAHEHVSNPDSSIRYPLPAGVTLRELRKILPNTVPLIVTFRYGDSPVIRIPYGDAQYVLRCNVPYVVNSGGEESGSTYLNPLRPGSAPEESNVPTEVDDWLSSQQWRDAGIEVSVEATGIDIAKLLEESRAMNKRHRELQEVMERFEQYLSGDLVHVRNRLVDEIIEKEFIELNSMIRGNGFEDMMYRITWDAQEIFIDLLDEDSRKNIEECIQESARRFFSFVKTVILPRIEIFKTMKQKEGSYFAFALDKYSHHSPQSSIEEGTGVLTAYFPNVGVSICVPYGNCPAHAISALDGLFQDNERNHFPTMNATTEARVNAGRMALDRGSRTIITSNEGLDIYDAVFHGDESIESCLQTLYAASHPKELVPVFPYVVFKQFNVAGEHTKQPDSDTKPIVITLDDLK